MAPPGACRGQEDAGASVAVQERAMRCLTRFARRRAGRPAFAAVLELERSAGLKSEDILRCDDFDHEDCGRDFAYWIDRLGYLGVGLRVGTLDGERGAHVWTQHFGAPC
jgi:hypothetical protein